MTRSKEAWVKFLATRLVGMLTDVAVLGVAYALAFMLRFDFQEPRWGWHGVVLSFVTVCAVHLACLLATGCYRLAWRRISVGHLPRYVLATALAALLLTLARLFLPMDTLSHVRPPYSITLISFFLSTLGLVSVRYLWRLAWNATTHEESLLDRDLRKFDNTTAARFFAGRTVLVTGAGGSIGSEIVRQVAAAGAKRVLMVERCENALYEIDRHMRREKDVAVCVPLMIDCGDAERMERVFEDEKPSVVLHAAAYKHVPMVEMNPDEGWRNNLGATKTLAQLAKRHGVERFVMISTDKAVNPVSVMGQTKRAAEEAVMALNIPAQGAEHEAQGTSFCAVRFGNVFGSSGSVVPLFRELIARKEPLTVTHPDMKRYFMTVSEAVNLVLQAASRKEGAIYTLDMGEPVRIVDLAEGMIAQAGYRPYVDIPIVFTGIRPGEKLFEELDVSEKSCYKTDMAKIYITRILTMGIVCLLATETLADLESGHILRYETPAMVWNEALPLGNGRLGGMVFGAPAMERVELNEETYWAGGLHEDKVYGLKPLIDEARQRILAGDADGAFKTFVAKTGNRLARKSQSLPYLSLAALCLKFDGHDFPTDYRRSLSLEEAVTVTEYAVGGVRYRREVLTSLADDVMALRLTASKPGQISFIGFLETASCDTVALSEELGGIGYTNPWLASNSCDGVPGQVHFKLLVVPEMKGGTCDIRQGTIYVKDADEVILWVSAATSFKDYAHPDAIDAHAKAQRLLEAARARGYASVRHRHVEKYRTQFCRARIRLGHDAASERKTIPRLLKESTRTVDPYLAELYYAFGRYLLIASSQPGGQPPTLQGIWNNSIRPPWRSSYTTNINLEMNYWPAESGGLGDLVEPLLKMLEECSVTGAETAREYYGARGWTMHHQSDIWRMTTPVQGAGGLWPTAGAWLSIQLWEHWLYTRDRAFLARAYPVLKGAALFFVDTLVRDPSTGNWTVVPGISPENRPKGRESNWTRGASSDAQILRDLFTAVCEAARELRCEAADADLLKEIAVRLPKLEPLRIGRWGQLQEWTEDLDDPKDTHRHLSHLYALYPSAQITSATPELQTAARISLEHRGDEATGWGMGWRACLWARLGDGDHALDVLKNQFLPVYATIRTGKDSRGGTYPNLFDSHPPFQIDGNFGCAAAIAEMLLQSHEKTDEGRPLIRLLPALPKAWAAEGSVTGLRARGGYVVNFNWKDGRVISHEATGGDGRPVIRVGRDF